MMLLLLCLQQYNKVSALLPIRLNLSELQFSLLENVFLSSLAFHQIQALVLLASCQGKEMKKHTQCPTSPAFQL